MSDDAGKTLPERTEEFVRSMLPGASNQTVAKVSGQILTYLAKVIRVRSAGAP